MKKRTKENTFTETQIYIAGLIACGLLLIGILIYFIFDLHLQPCFFRFHMGIFCPACGATRAVMSLLRADILSSIYYNPFIPYAFFVTVYYLITQTIERVTKRTFRFTMRFKGIYIYIGIVLLLINFILKNV